MAKLTLGLMQERTMNALAAHADANTVKAIGDVLNTGGIVAILKVHRQIEEETVRRWLYRDALKKNEYRDIHVAVYSAWQRCIDAKLMPMMVLTHTRLMQKVAEHIAKGDAVESPAIPVSTN